LEEKKDRKQGNKWKRDFPVKIGAMRGAVLCSQGGLLEEQMVELWPVGQQGAYHRRSGPSAPG